MSHDPIGYTFSGGYALCADCCTDETDEQNETGEAAAVFVWDEAAVALTCDACQQVLAEAAGFSL